MPEDATDLPARLRARAYADQAPIGGGLFTPRGLLEMEAANEIERLRKLVDVTDMPEPTVPSDAWPRATA